MRAWAVTVVCGGWGRRTPICGDGMELESKSSTAAPKILGGQGGDTMRV